jgi:hypothetical protein
MNRVRDSQFVLSNKKHGINLTPFSTCNLVFAAAISSHRFRDHCVGRFQGQSFLLTTLRWIDSRQVPFSSLHSLTKGDEKRGDSA